MSLRRQILLASLLLVVAQTATAERVVAVCQINHEYGTHYTYTAVASALWTVGTLNPTCEPPYTCDYVNDYLYAQVDIEGAQNGWIQDTFAGWVGNPYVDLLGTPPGLPTYPTELDYRADYDVPLPTSADCTYGTLSVTGANNYSLDEQAFAVTNNFCWEKTLCYLSLSVTNGWLLPSAQQSYYNCTDCLGFFAMPSDSSYCFMGWSGDVNSTDPTISFCFGGSDKSLTATFDVCPPCDPATDPTCSCDPATDPTCGCDPVMDPTCCDPISDPTCGCDPAIDPSCGGIGDCDPDFDPSCGPEDDPIVINLSHGPWRLAGADNPVLFDIHATGHKVKIGWTATGTNLAFLALDRNGNGTVDDGSELFGNVTPLANGHVAQNGFEAIAQYDSNHDGVIDKKDPIWKSLLLWVDRNHDGICQPDELTPISYSQVTSIGLSHRWTGRRDTSGNTFRYKGAVRFGKRAQSFFDIFFVTVH